jgi:outer membrane protein OmpA-like peptidoglycan-associated protein
MGARDLKPKPLTAAALAVWAAGAAAVAAQDLSDAELLARFKAQRAAIQAAERNPALGASRGLVLTNVAPAQEAVPGAATDAPGAPAAIGGTATLTLPGAAATTAPGEPLTLTTPGTEGAPVVHVSLPEDEQVNVRVTFAFDSSALAEDQKPKLRQICGVLKGSDIGVMRIVGHTDASGSASYNQQLSVLRAEEVVRFFVGECGVAADRLQAIGVGEQFPYDDRDPNAGVNRRVEFQAIS